MAHPHPSLRVCHVMSADLWAGAEVQVATVASYLTSRPDVELIAVLLNDGPLAAELRRLHVPVVILDEHAMHAGRILAALTRFLRANPVDVVHTHRYKDTVLGALAARLAGVPRVIRTVHGRTEPMEGWERIKYRAYDSLDRLVLRSCVDRIIAVSRGVADMLVEGGCRERAVVHIHNGIDVARVQPTRPPDSVRRELGVDVGAPLIGTVGRLSPVKGHAYFLEAARHVLDAKADARFLIVGDGPLAANLRDQAARLGLDRACIFSGAREDACDLMAAMDVFVLPSLDEGIPMALLEAMAIGQPSVATNVGGIPEVIAHRVNGLLVTARDSSAMAHHVLELLGNPRLARDLGDRARAIVTERFSRDANGHALMQLYCNHAVPASV